jgi:uncharacterized protein YgiM (DUF1202 family)
VKAPEANLRSGPGTRYEKLWEVFQYMPLKRVGKKGSWYKVSDVDGDTYWVYAPLVTTKYQCAVVRKDKANVRSGPGTEYRQLPMSPALKYYSFKVLKTQGKWVLPPPRLDSVGERPPLPLPEGPGGEGTV